MREAVQMIEIMARVLFGWMHGHDQWDDAQPEERKDCIEAARAVMAAMEQPSQKMIDAGKAMDDAGCPNDGDFGSVGTAEEHWRAMITAELKPE